MVCKGKDLGDVERGLEMESKGGGNLDWWQSIGWGSKVEGAQLNGDLGGVGAINQETCHVSLL